MLFHMRHFLRDGVGSTRRHPGCARALHVALRWRRGKKRVPLLPYRIDTEYSGRPYYEFLLVL